MKQYDKGYDERQTLERGKAFQTGYCTLALFTVLCFALNEAGTHWASSFSQMLIGLWGSILVITIRLIVTNAYDGIREGNFRILAIMLCLGGISIAGHIISKIADSQATIYNGIGELAVGVGALTIGTAYWVNYLHNKKLEKSEEKIEKP